MKTRKDQLQLLEKLNNSNGTYESISSSTIIKSIKNLANYKNIENLSISKNLG